MRRDLSQIYNEGIPADNNAMSHMKQVKYSSEGLAAIIFTAEGDMRQAINNLQSTHSGFGFVSPEAVFKVCDLPHPVTINKMISACEKGDIDNAMEALGELWSQGYSAVDIVSTIFRVVKNNETMPEYRKLEFIKVSCANASPCFTVSVRKDAYN